MTDFTERLAALTTDATNFAGEQLAIIQDAFAVIDRCVNEMRSAGISVEPRYPIGIREMPSATKFKLSFNQDLSPCPRKEETIDLIESWRELRRNKAEK